ncbi:MAG: 4a-hydroxytetrahydrobiopterin dehydratase [Solirubrobacterales bacterium]|jgi:hypothetical protein|nr:4a-hydroxytetrahydrobiopterin dehydratase [Solirubrobacterales bacterium]
MTSAPSTTEPITARQFHEAPAPRTGVWWAKEPAPNFRTGSFTGGARLVAAIGELSGLDDHSPDVDRRSEGATVRLIVVDQVSCAEPI